MSRIVFVLISISLWVTTVNAQVGHQYLHMADISGMYQLHAEMDTSSTITISTTAGIGYLSNSISLGDISNREGATRLIDFGLAHDQLKANNFFNYQNDINFLHLDYKINKSTTIRFGLNYKSHVQVEYSKELFQLLGNGNAQFYQADKLKARNLVGQQKKKTGGQTTTAFRRDESCELVPLLAVCVRRYSHVGSCGYWRLMYEGSLVMG